MGRAEEAVSSLGRRVMLEVTDQVQKASKSRATQNTALSSSGGWQPPESDDPNRDLSENTLEATQKYLTLHMMYDVDSKRTLTGKRTAVLKSLKFIASN